MSKPKALLIVGQTATGKTSLSIELAKRFNSEVISADSRQVYVGMDLGTGKVTQEEMNGVSHHLLDIKQPNEDFSAQEFQTLAQQSMEDIINRGNLPIICGGTGYYVQTLVDNIIFQDVPVNQPLRDELETKNIEELQTIVQSFPREDGVKIDTDNKRRLIRAIEIGTFFGKLFCVQNGPEEYEFLQIGVELPPEELRANIVKRIHDRLDQGMIEEVKKLHAEGISWKKLENFGLEYRYIAYFLQEKIDKETLIQTLEDKIWQYAKRQKTWFKQDDRIHWFHPIQDRGAIFDTVEQFLAKS
jgi:tRNA dimethylallyltransferase